MLQPALFPAPKCFTPLYADPVQAGFPSPAQGYEQQAIDLNELMVSNPPATFFVRAKGDSMVDAGIREGDLLVFYNAGAYGYEMSSNYNSRYKPAEVMVRNGKPKLIRKRDEFEDLLCGQIID